MLDTDTVLPTRDQLQHQITRALTSGPRNRHLAAVHLLEIIWPEVTAARTELAAMDDLRERAALWDYVSEHLGRRMTDDDDGEEDESFLIVQFVDRLTARAEAAEAKLDTIRAMCKDSAAGSPPLRRGGVLNVLDEREPQATTAAFAVRHRKETPA